MFHLAQTAPCPKSHEHRSAAGSTRNLIRLFVAGVFLLAIVLRLVGIGFGHGVLNPQPDEGFMRSGVLHSLTGDLNPHYAVWGHLFHYCYLAVAAAWNLIGWCSGRFETWTNAVAMGHVVPGELTALGRAVSAVAGALTVLATYRLGHEASGSRWCGAMAAALLSTLFLHVRDSHFATSDILLAALCTAALASMAKAGSLRGAAPGFWCGLALATKLLAVTVAFTFLTCIAIGCSRRGAAHDRWARVRSVAVFFGSALGTMLLFQPFLLLDPMETWYGWFGDLFNRERRPFEHGIQWNNGQIIARYYIPQATGWAIGGLAALGIGRLLLRGTPTRWVPLVYLAWSLIALLSVQRMFLRYLDPILPVLCVLAAAGADALGRWVAWSFGIACRMNAFRIGRWRLAASLAIVLVGAAPNLHRSILLDRLLLREDTRALAGAWIERHVPSGSRILWLAHGQLAAHMTMPWLQSPPDHDLAHAAIRNTRGLPTAVELATARWKKEQATPVFHLIGVSIGPDQTERSGFEAYPMLDHYYEIPLLKSIDQIGRRAGWLRRESPRWDLMRRQVSGVWQATTPSIASSGARYLVLTGQPCDPQLVEYFGQWYDEVEQFDPGVPWSEFSRSVMYDLGDAWYLPNYGLSHVQRPGPEVRIFRRR